MKTFNHNFQHPDITKGFHDLRLWRKADQRIHFIEVKRLNKDRVTAEQKRFAELAKEKGILTKVIEWE